MPRWPFGPRPLDPAHHQGHAGLIAALLVIAILIIALLGASACGAGESGAATANPAGLAKAQTDTTYVHLNGADHVLKQDPGGSASNYTKPLPFSPQLQAAIAAFVKQHL